MKPAPVALLSLAMLATGFGIGAWWTKPKSVPAVRPKFPPKTVALPTPPQSVTIKQDGKQVDLKALKLLYDRNPNRFTLQMEKSKFVVTGRIASIGAWTPSDQDKGFYIPLEPDPRDGDPIGIEPPNPQNSVALMVRGLSKERLAQLNPGDTINVRCLKIDLLFRPEFSECELLSRSGN